MKGLRPWWRWRHRREWALIRSSGLFDADWYRATYPDVAAAGCDPLLHFIRFGAAEGRQPGPAFQPLDFALRHPGYRAVHRNPLCAHILMGAAPAVPDTAADAVPDDPFDLAAERALFAAARSTPHYRAAYEQDLPLVTVCIATYNRAGVLVERALPSVLAQTWPRLQIVVVGDGCTDDTGARLAALDDPRIVFENRPRNGPYPAAGLARWQVAGSHAMNRAMELADGLFVTHLDDDDRMAPERIATLVEAMQRQGLDLCWHAFWSEDEDGHWHRRGDGSANQGQITTGTLFTHRHFARVRWDAGAFRRGVPADWDRLQRMLALGPRTGFVDAPLLHHHRERQPAK